MNRYFILNNKEKETARGRVILQGFHDPDSTIDEAGSKLKPDHAFTAHLGSKMSLKDIDRNLRRRGWLMHQSSFSSSFDQEAKHYWSMTKIVDSRGKNVTMRSALNIDPEGTLSSSFISEEPGGTFTAPPPVPEGYSLCSTIHTSEPQVRIDDPWGWAFDKPKK